MKTGFPDIDDAGIADLLDGLTDDELRQKLEVLRKLRDHRKYNQLEFFKPYPKQLEFFALGKDKRERLLTAGNQQGKTEAGAAEMAYHATGLYPEWWPGRRWNRPIMAWACGETSLVVRGTVQLKLCGAPGVKVEYGAGLIPRHLLVDCSLARGITDAYDTIQIKHATGGVSTISFKSYEQGREKFQGETLDIIWDDEEPDAIIYNEQLARLGPKQGMIYTTFTSMKGNTTLVKMFFDEKHPARGKVQMALKDALHYDTPAKIEAELSKYPVHERVARIEGGIMRGEGRVFSVSRDTISEPRLASVPESWAKIWGIDFGIYHPFAAVLIAWDKDADIIHVLRAIRMKGALPLQHAVPMKMVGADVPVAWPQDGMKRDTATGATAADSYKAQGLRMLPMHATFPSGSVSTEEGVLEMNERMTTGRFKVAADLMEWFDEFDNYHRHEALIVKVDDDLMSATRIALMMKRFAKPVVLGSKRGKDGIGNGGLALNVDFDVFA